MRPEEAVISPEVVEEFRSLDPWLAGHSKEALVGQLHSLLVNSLRKEVVGGDPQNPLVFYTSGIYLLVLSVTPTLVLRRVVKDQPFHKYNKLMRLLNGASDQNSEVKGPPLDMAKVDFSLRAVQRFAECFGAGDPNPGRTARFLLSRAKEDTQLSNGIKVQRLINNQFDPVRYFTNGDCRFIVKQVNERFRVITIEPIYGSKKDR